MPFANYENFEACVADNSDKQDPEAYCAAIKRQVEGEQALSEEEQQALEHSDCPEGHAMINGECEPIEEVENVPPTSLSDGQVYSLASVDTEPIERVEESENTVRYKHVKLLSPGVWTDSASRETIWYSPEGMKGLEIAEDNTVNIMHDAENEVSAAGEIDPSSVEASEDGVFADIVIDTSKAAGEYADENLQKTLETQGAKGFGGPSVEIDAEGQDVEFNDKKGMKELLGGIISGLGLVKNPASKPVSFARQTANRGVALSDSQTTMYLEGEKPDMDPEQKAAILSEFSAKELAGPQEVEEEAQSIADELDVPVGEVLEVLDPLFDMDDEEEPEEEDVENEDDEEPEDEEGEGDNPDEEDEEMDMENKIQSIEERLTNVEDMMEQAMAASEVEETLSEELEEAKSDLADAETAAELSEAVEGLEKRLESLEDEPKDPKSLSDGETEEDEAVIEGPIKEITPKTRY